MRGGLRYWQCGACAHQCSLISGTIFESTKLPLTRWFLAMQLLTQSKNNVSALELMRQLGVSYRTAWLLKHKIMEAMRVREQPRELDGRVEIDDAYLGGERSGGKVGRGSENKVPIVAAVQTTPAGQPMLACLRQQPHTTEEVAVFAAAAHRALGHRGLRRAVVLSRHHHRRRRARARRHRRGQGQREAAAVQGGQHAAGQPEDRHQRHLPCLRLRQVRPPLPRRVPVPLQPPIQHAHHPRRLLHALVRAPASSERRLRLAEVSR